MVRLATARVPEPDQPVFLVATTDVEHSGPVELSQLEIFDMLLQGAIHLLGTLKKSHPQKNEEAQDFIKLFAKTIGWFKNVVDPRWREQLSVIDPKTGLQQLYGTYVQPRSLMAMASHVRAGICQEVAQQVASYIGQLESSKVKNEVNFPTIESRDPQQRQAEYEAALDALAYDFRPHDQALARDLFPGEYADDDPRGDRSITIDERWLAITRSTKPDQFNLFFVKGDSVKIICDGQRLGAGVSMVDRYSGNTCQNPTVAASRSEKIQRRGYTTTKLWYAAIPIADFADAAVQGSIKNFRDGANQKLPENFSRHKPTRTKGGWRRKVERRKLRTELLLQQPSDNAKPAPITDEDKLPRSWRGKYVFIPLLGNRDRLEQALGNQNLEIAWTRIVCKHGEWYLQLTLRVPVPAQQKRTSILGISFSLETQGDQFSPPNAYVHWTLLEENSGNILEQGKFDNPNVSSFLTEKTKLEWDQKKGRWIGGRQFYKKLEETAHVVTNRIIALAEHHRAMLCIEDISYVQKSSQSNRQNVLFTAFNYGQMRRFVEYKSRLAGIGQTWFVSDYTTNLTCPSCGAIRKKGQAAENADTWRDNGTLNCRKCGYSDHLTGEQKSLRVGMEAIAAKARYRKAS